jgi:hypothetical protein
MEELEIFYFQQIAANLGDNEARGGYQYALKNNFKYKKD